MSSENPYQSPQLEPPRPGSSNQDQAVRQFPSWRLWVLAAIGCPVFYIAYLIFEVTKSYSEPNLVTWAVALLATSAIAALIASLLVAALLWRGTKRASTSGTSRPTLFFAALWFLSLFAVPSAFVSLCTPGLVADRYLPWLGSIGVAGWISGLFFGILGAAFATFIARGLWLDAVGRPRSPTPNEHTTRPLPPPADHQS